MRKRSSRLDRRAQRNFAHGSASERCSAFAASHCGWEGPNPEAVMSLYAASSSSNMVLPSISKNSGVSGKTPRLRN